MDSRILARGFKWVCINLVICLILFADPVVPSSTRVKSLPGFPGPLPFNLETGYIGVDEREDVQHFYYFFESEGNSREDPLMLWFMGGPACSGLSAIALEIGPIKFETVDYNGSLPTLELNPHSWTKAASIIFVDAPVGSGFSYSKSWEGSQAGDFAFAEQSANFLEKWLLAHPKFISNAIYLGGESYGGFIVPIAAEEIAKRIEAGHKPKFNFQGYLVGNPVTDTINDPNYMIPFTHRMALISDELYESVKKSCEGQYQQNQDNNPLCVNDLNAVSLCTENLNEYHILEPKCQSIFIVNGNMEESHRKSFLEMESDPYFGGSACPTLALLHFWANDKAVQRALHIQEGTIKTWKRCPKIENLHYVKDLYSVVNYHRRLNSKGYRALIYSGDHDLAVNYIGTQAWIKSFNLPIIDQWRPWLVEDQIAGYVTEYSKGLTFTTVKGGGHTAPQYRPKECFAMFKRWISQGTL